MTESATARRRLPALLLASAALAIATGPVCADEAEVSTLREQLEALRQQVDTLQQKLQALEENERKRAAAITTQPLNPAPAASGAVQPAAQITQHWRQVKSGMREDEVVKLLGEPAAKFFAGGQLTWYYKYPGRGVASVMFYDDGRVASTQPPPSPGWW